jgi:LmbE family N-acetylglucosaminyl deacetylase
MNRRDLLVRAGPLAGLSIGAQPPEAGGRRLRVVVTGGHPGDPEYGCGGTIARYTAQGHEVVLLYLNEGVPPGKPRDGVRVAEARHACQILGAKPLYAGQIDADAIVDRAHYEAFRKILEEARPDVVFTHWPIDNHADHRAISMLVYDAWVKMHRGFALYYYEVSDGEDTVQFSPNEYVDITDTEPKKKQACYAHASQAPDRFYELQSRFTRLRGTELGCRHAEAFVRLIQNPRPRLPGE